MTNNYDIVVIGGGPAGLSAAYSAFNDGAKKVLIIERDKELGGILNQCIHNGFGLHFFKEELTGPEYAAKFIDLVKQTDIEIALDTMVVDIDSKNKIVKCINTVDGYMEISAKAIILCMGCRERTRGAIAIPGDRPSGVFNAGTAQHYVNMEGHIVGKRVVILGSGDIGLIMARRMSLEGAKVLACIEIAPYSNGLTRNIVQCLNDFDIPLYLSHTITNIIGKERVEKVIMSKVDESYRPISGTETEIECDTVLLSVGLIPENELSKNAHISIDPKTNGAFVFSNMETLTEGIFAAGNVVHVHDLVDFVSEEGSKAGMAAADYINNINHQVTKTVTVTPGKDVNYTVPQQIRFDNTKIPVSIMFRVRNVKPKATITISCDGREIASFNRQHMAPSEMEKMVLKPEVLAQIDGNEIVVSVLDSEV